MIMHKEAAKYSGVLKLLQNMECMMYPYIRRISKHVRGTGN